MEKLLIFAGTTEGRLLVTALVKKNETFEAWVSCATEYGTELLPQEHPGIHYLFGRMTGEDMEQFIKGQGIDLVIDATHPYARLVTACISEAAKATKTPYCRLLREAATEELKAQSDAGKCIRVKSAEEAAAYLEKTKGKVLLTTGSKELSAFTKISDYKTRLYPRVLPLPSVVEHCFSLGFSADHLICMQGPFSYELNRALLKQTGAVYLVSKESGSPGGFSEKYRAAADLCVTLILISRTQEEGQTLEEVCALLGLSQPKAEKKEKAFQDAEEAQAQSPKKADWFPFFQNVKDRQILVIGGGAIAKRRITTLLEFSFRIKVVALEVTEDFVAWERAGRISLFLREYAPDDLLDTDYVLALANRDVNRRVYLECQKREIPVNIADCKEECDFYFPGVVKAGSLVFGVTAQGQDHKLAGSATQALALFAQREYGDVWDKGAHRCKEEK